MQILSNFVFIVFMSAFRLTSTHYDNDFMHPSSSQHTRNKRDTPYNENENSAKFWNDMAQATLKQHLQKVLNKNIAKNIIFFLGDGMSIATLAASRIYLGQKNGATGEETKLSFEKFPFTGLSKTYCVDKQVADSACSATAFLCGVKATYGTIGVTAAVKHNDCAGSNDKSTHVKSITHLALEADKNVGIVTTTRITHASPAGTYAHVGNRDWECDNDTLTFKNDPEKCQDIASQMINNEPANKFKVILGGGRSKFIPYTEKDDEGFTGQRVDGVNLIKKWQIDKGEKGQYVYDKAGLNAINLNKVESVLGLFDSDHMQYNLNMDKKTKPTLAEMTAAAIKILRHKTKNGYFLFVEGGRIDHAHHETKAQIALDETVEFAAAVQKATEMVNLNNTLIVVTSDHSHTMSMAGYANRGTNILGVNTETSDMDHLPYLTLSYANGLGYENSQSAARQKLSTNFLYDKNYLYPATVPVFSETHGGEDVAVFANGPFGHLFTGCYEQNVIPHIMAYAGCFGPGRTACKR